MPKTPDLHSINPDGTKTDTWIFEELLGADDVPDAAYRHIVPTEPPTSLYRDKLKALQLDWDEGEHPRADDGKFTDGSGGEYATSPDAPRGGDGQQALFEYAPESGSEQALRVDAKAGVKEVEKLLEAAVDDADYDLKVEAWDEVDSDDQNAVEEHFIDSGIGDSGAVEAGQQATDDYVNEHLNDADVHERVMEEGFASDFSAEADGRELDPDSVEGVWQHGEFSLDPSGLKYADGTPVSEEDAEVASQLYNRQSGAARQALEDDLRQSDEALEVASTAEREYAAEEWNNLSGSDRLQYATDHGFATGIKLRPGEPGEWKFDSDREEDEPETDEDYLRTRAIGLELVKDRTEAVMQARGVLSKDVTPDKIAGDLWHAWKTDSQSPLGLAMQIAVADELGTLPTASITAADRTAAEAAMVAAFTTAEEREKLHPSSSALIKTIDALPADQQADAWRKAEALEKTEKNAITTLAKTRVQAYARAQWETTQFLLQKAGADRVQMYRAIIRPAEEVNNTTRVPYAEGVRLPDYQLKHNAVASATTKPKVANEWNGVGVKVEQGKRERVVLRFDAPRTAVFSLPVYGQNVHAESEVVLIGTKGLKWDAWHQKGPGFDTRRIDMASFKLEVTVESDDTPDDTEKTPSVKKDGPVIDLLKDQDEHWLAPDHYRKPPQKIPTPKPETT